MYLCLSNAPLFVVIGIIKLRIKVSVFRALKAQRSSFHRFSTCISQVYPVLTLSRMFLSSSLLIIASIVATTVLASPAGTHTRRQAVGTTITGGECVEYILSEGTSLTNLPERPSITSWAGSDRVETKIPTVRSSLPSVCTLCMRAWFIGV